MRCCATRRCRESEARNGDGIRRQIRQRCTITNRTEANSSLRSAKSVKDLLQPSFMNIILPLCLLAFLGLGHCQNALPSRVQIETSINRTINEVERLIKEDPRLPRLSRTEIVDILHNITSKDMDSHGDKQSAEKARAEYQRALMVVLPYSPNSSKENLEDLYMKPPIVQMVPDSAEDSKSSEIFDVIDENGEMEEIVYPEKSRKPTHAAESAASDNSVVTENSRGSSDADEHMEESTGSYENHRDTYSEVVDPIDFKTSKISGGRYRPVYQAGGKQRVIYAESPEKFSFNLNNLQLPSKNPTVNTFLPTRISNDDTPEQFDDSLSTDSKLEIVYSTTVSTKKPTTTTQLGTEATPASVEPTTFAPEMTTRRHVLTSDQWHYHAPPPAMETPKKVYPEYKFHSQTSTASSQGQYNLVEPSSIATKKQEVSIRTHGQNKEKKYGNREQIETVETPSSIFVTPTKSSEKSKFSSSYAAKTGGNSKPTMPPMRSEVKDLLASIGLSEGDPGALPSVGMTSLPLSGSEEFTRAQIAELGATGINAPSILSQNTFGTANYDYKKGTQNLTPDMQLLLQRFGLQTSKEPETPSTTTKKPTPIVVNLNSYSNFKPLPTTNVENQDMRDFLAKFGLGTADTDKNRDHKSIKTRKNAETSPPSLIEAVPENMKKILENIGLISRSQKSVETKVTSTFASEKVIPSGEPHIFKPHEVPVHTEEQKEKINKLLDTVRKVQAGMASSTDVQMAAQDLLETTKTLQNGPDPLSLEEILNIYNEGIKNEVKRQEEATTPEGDSGATTSFAAESTTEATTSATSTTAADPLGPITSESTNIEALSDSFGGSTRAPDPVLPMQRKTGLYFLVDWNTFLEVGEEGPDRVNLRFQPKVGDRTRFIPVTVP
ncbi:uncharacterized protein LOC105688799 isoform X2 [Athalia rosae]|uniref:uncharacterized protein LOC105688799 isoform X2 n=1 Tax=Athalia rosae TaxID=37344 RepID=UPI002033E8E7|nr:uncharacterized protein LOC105688799 isoform X2 [Athalia rosae]